jgi:3-mercaptopyruvate sulfurtransferase SseA
MHRISPLFSALVAVAALSGCKAEGATPASSASTSTAPAEKAALKEMSVDDVDKRIAANDAKFQVFDCNEKETYAEGHVPSAKWVPAHALTADMLPSDKTTTLVFYCANEH